MVRTEVVTLTTIQGMAYKKKLSAGGAGIAIITPSDRAAFTINKRDGKAVPYGKVDSFVFTDEAVREAVELTRNLPFRRLGTITKVYADNHCDESSVEEETEDAKVEIDIMASVEYKEFIAQYTDKKEKFSEKIYSWGFIIFFLGMLNLFMLPTYIYNTAYSLVYVIGMICSLCLLKIHKEIPRRTEEYNIMLGKVKGFRNFLELAEKEQLDNLVEDNPSYFYDISPYAYVLDVSNKWINVMEAFAGFESNSGISEEAYKRLITSQMIMGKRIEEKVKNMKDNSE